MATNHTLKPLGILADLHEIVLEGLAQAGKFIESDPGDIIVAQGIHQDSLYIVASGSLQIHFEDNDHSYLITEISEGSCVGEANMFSPSEAIASVNVLEPSVLWKIDKEEMSNFLISYPKEGFLILGKIVELMSNRMKELNEKMTAIHKICSNTSLVKVRFSELEQEIVRPTSESPAIPPPNWTKD